MHAELEIKALCKQEPAEDYHRNTRWLSRGMLQTFQERRRLFERYYVKGKKSEKPPTDSMAKGTLCHSVLLEGKAVEDCVTIIPPEVLNADGHKKGGQWKEFQLANIGKILMKQSEADEALAIVNSVVEHPQIGPLHRKTSFREYSIYWTEGGLNYRCRPDWLIVFDDMVMGIDFKTAKDASEEGFRKPMMASYAFQKVHYTKGIEAYFGKPCSFFFVATDNDEPYTTYMHQVTEEGEVIALRDWEQTTRDLAGCFESGNWADKGEGEVIQHSFTEKEYSYAKGW